MIERIPLAACFAATKPLIGMVHLAPLPGAPRYGGDMAQVIAEAVRAAVSLADAGADGVLVENFGDAPYYPSRVPPVTVAALARCVTEIAGAVTLPVGVNVLRNDAAAALAIALATGAVFVRVNVHAGALLTDQGWIEGRAHETLRERVRLGASIAIFADVLVKHAVAPAGLDARSAARDLWSRGLADALIVSGAATGEVPAATELGDVRAAVPDAPLLIGSGLDASNAAELMRIADGAIVGSALCEGGRAGAPVDTERASAVFAAARGE
jgi:uncharacterized protein